jgi:hypothetical protein
MNNLTIKSTNNLCSYYVANVDRHLSNYFVAIIKSFDNLVFDRTIDVETSLFEFFVPASCEEEFLSVMDYFIQEGLVANLRKTTNRLSDDSVAV